MNRTNEYSILINSSPFVQNKIPPSQLKNPFLEIENTLSFLEKQTSLDEFTSEQKIKKIKNLISNLEKEFVSKNENEKMHFKNVIEITDGKIKRYLLRINKLKKQKNSFLLEETKRRESFVHYESEVAMEKKEEQENVHRKRMISQLNELGQIISDISLHVSLQGEQIKRIDEVVDESNNFVKEAFFEINKTWERISDQRKRMIKYFSFWILFAFFIWLWKKH